MAENFLAGLRDNLLLRASVATVAGIVLLGVASGALPLTCFVGLSACDTAPIVDTSVPTIVPSGEGEAGARVAKVAEIAPPTLTRNDVVGGTFAMLDVELSAPPGDSELKTRKVKTVAIGPDGQPQGAASAAPVKVAAAPRQVTVTSQSPTEPARGVVATGSSSVATQHSTAVATELAVDQPAPDEKSAVVKNGGANVRSSPSKANSTVLFALPGGTLVSTGEDRRGWIKVTDPKGRSGWVYQDLLVRE